ncbi:hypothetical protein [Alteromonas sp. CYL-A6]|uniref:hypothetical protein n=1 Tax=Alteromonas nitratireducens TaxID=3390813 RepID=UPI0034B7011A
MMKKRIALLSLVCAFTSQFAVAEETRQVMVVDTSGKPPFKRSIVEVPVSDIAQFEAVSQNELETTRQTVVDYRGKPPYSRRVVEMPVVDVAQFEEITDAQNRDKLKGSRPPFKR